MAEQQQPPNAVGARSVGGIAGHHKHAECIGEEEGQAGHGGGHTGSVLQGLHVSKRDCASGTSPFAFFRSLAQMSVPERSGESVGRGGHTGYNEHEARRSESQEATAGAEGAEEAPKTTAPTLLSPGVLFLSIQIWLITDRSKLETGTLLTYLFLEILLYKPCFHKAICLYFHFKQFRSCSSGFSPPP